MNPARILEELERAGVHLEVVGDKIRMRPPEAIPAEMLNLVRRHKPALLDLLRDREARNEAEIRRLLAGQGWVVVRCRALEGARALWTLSGGTQVPQDVVNLPRYTIEELERIIRQPSLLKSTHAVKVFFTGAEVEEVYHA